MSVLKKEFVLKHVFEDISSLEDGEKCYSEEEVHFNVPWRIYIHRKNGDVLLLLYCPKPLKSGEWSIEAESELKLMFTNGKHLIQSRRFSFNNITGNNKFTVGQNVIKWEEMIKDCTTDDKIMAEVHVKITEITGEYKKNLRNFDETMKQFSDIVLVVEKERFHVSKLFLSSQSKHFLSMLLGKSDKSKQSVITLTDVNSEHLQNFLELLHGEPAINAETVDGNLFLANKYDAQTAVRRCEEFLIEKSEKTLKEKLETATKYNLKCLKDTCFANIKTIDDIRSVVPDNLEQLDDSLAAALLKKVISREC